MASRDLNHTHGDSDLSVLAKMAPIPIVLEDHSTEDEHDLFKDGDSMWCANCYIGEPTIIQGFSGGKYSLWTIEFETIRGSKFKIRKRFNDFVELKSKLDKYKLETVIPSLPPKTMLLQDRFNPDFLQKRRKALEYWLTSIVLNPVLSSKPEVKTFVLDALNH